LNPLSILTVPAFDDNYLWIIHNQRHALIVDPGDAQAIIHALQMHQLTPIAILLTHHHRDHIGGVNALVEQFAIPVYGPIRAEMPSATQLCQEGNVLNFSELDLRLRVMELPGHTVDHIAYYDAERDWLFSGDVLFGAGCGRLFDGTAPQLYASLQRIAALPDQTQVYCAHEYTLANLRFALAVEPDNELLKSRLIVEQTKRDADLPTVPLDLAVEKRTNPFLRVNDEAILQSLIHAGKLSAENKCIDDACRFSALRKWKDGFK
jgi:hydroxyacylglutathione hydrolase